MASSSTLTADSISLSGEYEVFLSFCGKDTRNGFTDFLYTYLQGASVLTFRDDNELRVGEEIGPELLRAIKNSKISIPIFSKNYASSKWCLMELVKIVECHAEAQGEKMIFPIFYDVDPHDVRHQSGSYEEAFRQHKEKKWLEVQTIQNWKEALARVGQLKGMELKKETGGREGELVKIVVEKVLEKLKKNYTLLPKNLVGIDQHVENLKRLLKVDSRGVRIVGIHGMGGLGKTTIAKVTYNQLCGRFENHCFLDNVRENSKRHDGILDLQSKLISNIQKGVVPKLSDVDEGRRRIKDTIFGRKVLIVLDDVDEISQVDMLMGNRNWFGTLSRIIITTRDTDVLCAIETACQIEGVNDVCTSYKPEYMDDGDSIQLFSKYAFMRDSPMEGYEHLSEEVVSIAAGLPLVLVVLGSAFFGVKDKELWEAKLKKLRIIPHEEVQEKLRFSFEALQYEQKQIFLDIACLFIERDIRFPSYMWEGCGFYPREDISILVSKSLVTFDDRKIFIMHDQLRDLGRQIVREEGLNELGKRSRLWCKEEAMQVLETSQGTSSVVALCLPYQFPLPEDPVLASYFYGVSNLRYLDMGLFQDLDGDFKHSFPNLRWLRWMSTGKFSPTNLHMKNLVILDLSFSTFTKDWEDLSQLKTGNKLKVLDLSACVNIRVLPHLSMFASLEVLRLFACRSLCRLDGLEQLKSLKYLYASECYNLETLPSLSNLTNLVELNLYYCKKLVEIQGLDKLESLQDLNISNCSSLERLPDFSNLKKLKKFKDSCCWKLIEIEGLEKLESLQKLDITECESLERLPDFSNLGKLTKFKARDCRNLIEIEGLETLESLEHLDLMGCSSLKGLLDISNLNNLQELYVPTSEVTNFLNLKKSKTLKIMLSNNLIDFQGLHLEILDIYDCKKLIEIQGLDRLESLKKLSIYNCSSLERLPDLPNFGILKEIKVARCNKLQVVEGVEVIESLESLEISYCDKLREIPNLRRLKNLKTLYLFNCSSLERLPDLLNFGILKEIKVRYCFKLQVVEGVEVIESLESLEILYCGKLREIPNLRRLKNLKTLRIYSFEEQPMIHGLEELKSLESLCIPGCNSIEALVDFLNLQKLMGMQGQQGIWFAKHGETSYSLIEMKEGFPEINMARTSKQE